MTNEPQPLIWARLSSQGRGPVRTLDHEMITNAAIAIADQDGLNAVSMRKIAGRLERSTMSLYRHIGGKDDLEELMYDAVLGELDLADVPTADWRSELAQLARGSRQIHHRHPWFSRLGQRPWLGPNAILMFEYGLASVDGLGLGIDAMHDLVTTALQFTQGYVQAEMAEAEAQRRTGLDKAQWHEQMAPFVFQLLAQGRNPYMERFVKDAEDFPDSDVVFERRLGMVLDGLAASLQTGAATTASK